MNQHSEGTGADQPFIVKSDTEKRLEAEIEELEGGLKDLQGEAWSERAGVINAKERELTQEREKILGYVSSPSATPKMVMPESTLLQQQNAFKAREKAFAQAKRRGEEMRASYAKPYVAPAPASGIWSRLTSWWRGAKPVQQEARQKISEALAPEVTQQRARQELVRQEATKRNAAAYEAMALGKSRAAQQEEKEDKAQAAK